MKYAIFAEDPKCQVIRREIFRVKKCKMERRREKLGPIFSP
jgi:hypothetical protein